MWATDIRDIVGLPFDAVAARRGAHWKLSDEEKDRFALALSRVGAKHFPWILERFGEELSLGICFASMLYVRVKTDSANVAAAKALAMKAGSDEASGDSDPT